ncbi:hypothetical protein BJX66DRAFT_307670 [Aspergillus keveii]|uniref:Secreted protein n=1 Tax=Aspergillus keveii TaxID=714993 RepID=A0ABR4G0L4_9EURO
MLSRKARTGDPMPFAPSCSALVRCYWLLLPCSTITMLHKRARNDPPSPRAGPWSVPSYYEFGKSTPGPLDRAFLR